MTFEDRLSEREARSRKEKKANFVRWLDEPMVRMAISMIPAGDKIEALQMLLQSAFDAGHRSGLGEAVSEIVGTMLTAKRNDRRQ